MSTNFHFTSDIPPDSTLALGDVHGQIELLEQFVDWVRDSDARVIFLGDLIDRATNPGDDLKVLELVRQMCESPEDFGLASCTSLVGNHEILFLNALDGYDYRNWISNGGSSADMDNMESYAGWLRSLPYYVTVGDTLFTHSGGVYGKNPADSMNSCSNREGFVWSRTAPLRGAGLSKWSQTLKKSVFGHTPKSAMPYKVGDSICIDSGAYHFGVLTAYNSTYDWFTQFELEV
jgi:hypothetical protein